MIYKVFSNSTIFKVLKNFTFEIYINLLFNLFMHLLVIFLKILFTDF